MNYEKLVDKKFSDDNGHVYKVLAVGKCDSTLTDKIVAKSVRGEVWVFNADFFLERFDCTREVK